MHVVPVAGDVDAAGEPDAVVGLDVADEALERSGAAGLPKASPAPFCTWMFSSFSAWIRSGTASFVAGPILFKAEAALRRTLGPSSFSTRMRAGTASLAAGPILPKA